MRVVPETGARAVYQLQSDLLLVCVCVRVCVCVCGGEGRGGEGDLVVSLLMEPI